jgi:regulator of protease activity HflC (stomatin/prohibitin superfamily)
MLKNFASFRTSIKFVKNNSNKRLASNFISSFDDDIDRWPLEMSNTILNVCPEATMMVVERLGKLHSIKSGGWFVAVPIIDRIRFVIDMREKALSITPQSAITKDNVHVKVSGNLYCQFVDAEKAAYGSKNPIYSIKQIAQSSMRSAIGELELDQILHARAHLNSVIRTSVIESASSWGLDVKRYEITDISPDKFITDAMDKQAAAERDRRKQVLGAEGDKRSAELESEGVKIRMKNESEGTLIKVTNEAEARKAQLVLEVFFFCFLKLIQTKVIT